jgi:hypothetical protein
MPDTKTWHVTFGLGHRLYGGSVAADDDHNPQRGMPLGGFYVTLQSENRDAARARVVEVFGPGNWAELYGDLEGRRVIAKHGLVPLLTQDGQDTLGAVSLCDCLGLPYPHCAGAHDDDDDEVPRFSDGSRAPVDWSYPERRPLDDLDENPEETQ